MQQISARRIGIQRNYDGAESIVTGDGAQYERQDQSQISHTSKIHLHITGEQQGVTNSEEFSILLVGRKMRQCVHTERIVTTRQSIAGFFAHSMLNLA